MSASPPASAPVAAMSALPSPAAVPAPADAPVPDAPLVSGSPAVVVSFTEEGVAIAAPAPPVAKRPLPPEQQLGAAQLKASMR